MEFLLIRNIEMSIGVSSVLHFVHFPHRAMSVCVLLMQMQSANASVAAVPNSAVAVKPFPFASKM